MYNVHSVRDVHCFCGTIGVVTEKEFVEVSVKTTDPALSIPAPIFQAPESPSVRPTVPLNPKRGSIRVVTAKSVVEVSVQTTDPALSMSAPMKISNFKELLDNVFAENMADIQSMIIGMVLKDWSVWKMQVIVVRDSSPRRQSG